MADSGGVAPARDAPVAQPRTTTSEKTSLDNSSKHEKTPAAAIHDADNEDHERQGPETLRSNQTVGSIFTWDLWLKEIGALLVSLLATAAIVGLLVKVDNKPRPEKWHKISLNTVISILSTVQRVALLVPVSAAISQMKWLYFSRKKARLTELQLFEDASKGTSGSAMLLLKLGLKTIASIGAFVTIIALAMGPFTQQVISYPVRPVLSKADAELYQARYYQPTTSSNIKPYLLPESTIQAAGLDGLFHMNDYDNINFYTKLPICKTSNCVYPIKPSFVIQADCKAYPYDFNFTTSCADLNATSTCEWVLPNGLRAPNQNNAKLFFASNSVANTELYKDFKGPLLAATTLFQPQSYPGSPSTLNAEECIIYPAVRKYSVTNTGGVYREDITGDPWTTLESSDWQVGQDIKFASPPADFNATAGDIYGMNATAFIELQNFALDTFQANLTKVGDQVVSHGTFIEALSIISGVSPPKAFAKAITSAIRQQSFGPFGDTVNEVVYVQVNWPWLALPLLTVLLGAIFVLIAIVDNYMKRVVLWKGNVLALMFHGLDDDVLGYAGAPHSDAEMKKRAADVSVKLQSTQHGLKLSHA